MRGFAIIALHKPKTPENVGGVLRAAHCYGAAQVNISGARNKWLTHSTNTPQAHKHTPTFLVNDCLDYIPNGAEIVAIDLVDGATPLPSFRHPQRACYVFGPEDGTLGRSITDRAQHKVYIPTRNCMNLAACVNVVLYDRLTKSGDFHQPYERMDQRQIYTRAVA